MNTSIPTPHLMVEKNTAPAFSPPNSLAMVTACLLLYSGGQAQTITDNFDTQVDAWTHYAPVQTAPWNEPVSWTFTPDPAGGYSYRIFGGVPGIGYDPGTGNNTGPARVGSFRNDGTYLDFLAAVDLVNWNDSIPDNTAFLAYHVTAPGFLTTFGFYAGYGRGAWNDQQASFAFVHFQSELTVSVVNEFTGGAALVSRLNPAKKYRMVVTGANTLYTGAIYDRTDLLEPIVRIAGTDPNDTSGTCGIGAVNYSTSNDRVADATYDNYYSSSSPTDPVGFPGVAQVTELSPAAQTLFYTIPAANRIQFAVQTFNSTQLATNNLQMFLNGTNVTPQLVLSNRATVLNPNPNFAVRYTGPLASNTIYNGRIIALDNTGKGTTNNFVFDTFSTNGSLIVEAEDYNYSAGQFQDNPPVSGLDTNGAQINGGGAGYYGLTGVRDVDYYDTDGGSGGNYHQYRPGDGVGTFQGRYVGDTPRTDHTSTNVPDYALGRMQAGEWLNYTRTFPSNRWNVYLRTSSQAREDVRFDEVTGDTTQPNQAKVLRGDFLVPNTGSTTRFRYVPLTDAAGNPQVLDFQGLRTFRMTALGGFDSGRQHGGDDNGSLQPNYFLFLPTTAPAPTTPWIASASPSTGATDVSLQPTVNLVILNRASSVSLGSIQLRMDGTNVTGSSTVTNTTSEGSGATVTYTPPGYLMPNTSHTLSLVFSDGSTTQSNQWSFTTANVPLVPATSRVAGSATTNFSIQMAKAPNSPYANAADDHFVDDSWSAERHLANQLIQPSTLAPYTNEVANTPTNYGFYSESLAINYQTCGNLSGFFGSDQPFPGISTNWCPGAAEHFAMAATIKLSLPAGIYRMGVRSDDGFKVTVTTNTVTVWTNAPQTEIQLGVFDGPRGNNETTFDFVVATNGVYQFRLVYEQGGADAACEWYWVDRTTGVRRLINQPPIPVAYAVAPSGGVGDRGFNIQIHQARTDAPESDFPNSSARAEQQLANQIIDGATGLPYVNLAANSPNNQGLYIDTGAINYEQNAQFAGFFGADKPFPGIPPNYAPFVAMAATTYLDLPAGNYSFGVRSDDGFKMDTGLGPVTTNLNLGIYEGGRGSGETTFSVVVGTSGVYPFRLLYYQGTGGADVEFYSFDPITGARMLINDPTNPNALKAYRTAGYRLLNARTSGNSITFDIPTLPGKTITVEYKNALTDPAWTPLSPTIAGDGTVKTVSFPISGPKGFFHLKVN